MTILRIFFVFLLGSPSNVTYQKDLSQHNVQSTYKQHNSQLKALSASLDCLHSLAVGPSLSVQRGVDIFDPNPHPSSFIMPSVAIKEYGTDVAAPIKYDNIDSNRKNMMGKNCGHQKRASSRDFHKQNLRKKKLFIGTEESEMKNKTNNSALENESSTKINHKTETYGPQLGSFNLNSNRNIKENLNNPLSTNVMLSISNTTFHFNDASRNESLNQHFKTNISRCEEKVSGRHDEKAFEKQTISKHNMMLCKSPLNPNPLQSSDHTTGKVDDGPKAPCNDTGRDVLFPHPHQNPNPNPGNMAISDLKTFETNLKPKDAVNIVVSKTNRGSHSISVAAKLDKPTNGLLMNQKVEAKGEEVGKEDKTLPLKKENQTNRKIKAKPEEEGKVDKVVDVTKAFKGKYNSNLQSIPLGSKTEGKIDDIIKILDNKNNSDVAVNKIEEIVNATAPNPVDTGKLKKVQNKIADTKEKDSNSIFSSFSKVEGKSEEEEKSNGIDDKNLQVNIEKGKDSFNKEKLNATSDFKHINHITKILNETMTNSITEGKVDAIAPRPVDLSYVKIHSNEQDPTEGKELTEGKDVTDGKNPTEGKGQLGGENSTEGKGLAGGKIPTEDKGLTGEKNPTEGKGQPGGKNPTEGKGLTGEENPTEEKGLTEEKNPIEEKGHTGEKSNQTEEKGIAGENNPAEGKGLTGGENPIEEKGIEGEKNPTEEKGIAGEKNPTEGKEFEGGKKNTKGKGITGGENPTEEKGFADGKNPSKEKDLKGDKNPTEGKYLAGEKKPTEGKGLTGEENPIDGKGISNEKDSSDDSNPTDENVLTEGKDSAKQKVSTEGKEITDGEKPSGENNLKGDKSPTEEKGFADGKIPSEEKNLKGEKNPTERKGLEDERNPSEEKGITEEKNPTEKEREKEGKVDDIQKIKLEGKLDNENPSNGETFNSKNPKLSKTSSNKNNLKTPGTQKLEENENETGLDETVDKIKMIEKYGVDNLKEKLKKFSRDKALENISLENFEIEGKNFTIDLVLRRKKNKDVKSGNKNDPGESPLLPTVAKNSGSKNNNSLDKQTVLIDINVPGKNDTHSDLLLNIGISRDNNKIAGKNTTSNIKPASDANSNHLFENNNEGIPVKKINVDSISNMNGAKFKNITNKLGNKFTEFIGKNSTVFKPKNYSSLNVFSKEGIKNLSSTANSFSYGFKPINKSKEDPAKIGSWLEDLQYLVHNDKARNETTNEFLNSIKNAKTTDNKTKTESNSADNYGTTKKSDETSLYIKNVTMSKMKEQQTVNKNSKNEKEDNNSKISYFVGTKERKHQDKDYSTDMENEKLETLLNSLVFGDKDNDNDAEVGDGSKDIQLKHVTHIESESSLQSLTRNISTSDAKKSNDSYDGKSKGSLKLKKGKLLQLPGLSGNFLLYYLAFFVFRRYL